MAASVFSGTPQKLNGVIRAEDVILDFGGAGAAAGLFAFGAGAAGALVQQVELTCERTVNMIYEIGSSNVYYVGDRRRGTARFNRVVGGSATFKNMINQFGNLCNSSGNNIVMTVGASSCAPAAGGVGGVATTPVTYTLLSATLNSLGLSVTAQDIVVTESMSFMFIDLEYA